MNRIISFFNSNLSLWVIIGAVIAYFFSEPFLYLKQYINVFFAITMFGIGLVITKQDYLNVIRNPKQILFGNICQFTIMPLLALLTSYIFSLPKEITVGLILTGAAPGAMTSNVISYLADGDVAYSVSLTAVATLLSPLLTPLITLVLAGSKVPVPFFNMFLTIIYTVLLPLVLGFLVRYKFPSIIKKIGELPTSISISSIVIITSYVVAANSARFGLMTFILVLAVIFHNIAGMFLGFFAGRMANYNFKRKKTLSIEIGMQNAGLGVILALKHFSAKVAIPAAIFTIWCILSASVVIYIWKVLERRNSTAI